MTTETSNKTRLPVSQASKRKAPAPQDQMGAAVTSAQADKDSSAPKEPNKTDKVLALLKRTEGATLDDLVQATGWLNHTTRAALTGLKKKGHSIERTKVDGVSRYILVQGGSR